MLKFSFLTGDVNWLDYGGKWMSQKLNNGEFDYWLVRELAREDEYDPNSGNKYLCTLSVVAPSQISSDRWTSIIESCGYDTDEYTDSDRVEMAHSYGASNQVWDSSGNNYKELFKECGKEAQVLTQITFGFAMDRRVNGLGDTGWSRIAATSILDTFRQ